MIGMMSSPARPMDLDEDDYFPATNFQYRSLSDGHQTPVTKTNFSQDCHFYQTPPLFRIVHNPFDPPTSAHLKQRLASPSIFRVLSQTDDNDKTRTSASVFDWSVEQLAELHPKRFSDENLIQIDAALFDENLMQRYQRAAYEFCSSKLHLPTPAAPNNQQEKALSIDEYGYYCANQPMTSPFLHFDVKTTTSIFQRDFQNRPPVDFDSCVMEQCDEIPNTSLDTSFNITNQTSRLSNGGAQTNVSLLKRRLFEDEEEDDVNLLPDDNDQYENGSSDVTSTQRPNLPPPQCDSETEDDHRISSPSNRLQKQLSISPILTSSFLFDADCSPIKKD
ncbi:unnamed protein product [Rotaria magnacalcarata]|uniref:Protein aurora borealis n=4 Tax=Rotaria magnacalcarata TaxID=392030 RepID=A0A816Y713_9BILA|nr:unnamed protein product [Rotaria magnacalcarata]CAF2153199.1 unnamed protein product [Rotaria magnacalcarata]